MSDAVAITGIVVSGVVGPSAGALLANHQYQRTRRSEREDELLHVLDDVLLYVNRGRRALEATAELARQGTSPSEIELRAAWDVYASETLPPMRAAFQRVFVRLGRAGEIPEVIEDVRNAFFALRAPIDKYREGGTWVSALQEEYTSAQAAFMQKQESLYVAVYVRVGLPSDSERSKRRLRGFLAI